MTALAGALVLAATALIVVALVADLATLSRRTPSRSEVPALAASAGTPRAPRGRGTVLTAEPPPREPEPLPAVTPVSRTSTAAGRLGWVLLTGSLIARALATGHGPFANQYEFAVAFAWGLLSAYLVLGRGAGERALGLAVNPIVIALLLYARTVGDVVRPLRPALAHVWLLPVHVAAAVFAYGAAGVAGGCAVLYLLAGRVGWSWLPRRAVLDELGYRAALVAFPLMTLMIVLGAIWADIAWGHYWSWDPKETAALATWLIYAAYLHARVVRDWRGDRASWLLILGFVAVLVTYFGNLFFGGMHTYA